MKITLVSYWEDFRTLTYKLNLKMMLLYLLSFQLVDEDSKCLLSGEIKGTSVIGDGIILFCHAKDWLLYLHCLSQEWLLECKEKFQK